MYKGKAGVTTKTKTKKGKKWAFAVFHLY
jgi:hypothetical protein